MSDEQKVSSPDDEKEAKAREARLGRRLWIGALIFLGACAVLAIVFSGQGGPTERDAERVCQQSVEARLKAPSTADFRGSAVSENGGQWTVRGEVDAENSFGAAIRNTYVCTLVPTDDGDDLSLVDVEISE